MMRKHNKAEPPRLEDQWMTFTEHEVMVEASAEFLRRLAEQHPERKPPEDVTTR